jgi:hypothetical protein
MHKNLESIVNTSSLSSGNRNFHLINSNKELFKEFGFYIFPEFIDNVYKLSDEIKKKKKRFLYIGVITGSILLNSYKIYYFGKEIFDYLLNK